MASRTIASCVCQTGIKASPYCSQSRDEPSMSVNNIVTTPVGILGFGFSSVVKEAFRSLQSKTRLFRHSPWLSTSLPPIPADTTVFAHADIFRAVNDPSHGPTANRSATRIPNASFCGTRNTPVTPPSTYTPTVPIYLLPLPFFLVLTGSGRHYLTLSGCVGAEALMPLP